MSSAKREHEYDMNRQKYREVQSGFKFSLISTLVATGAVFACMTIYYFIRMLAMVAGSSLMFGQALANIVTGENKTTGLEYTVDYGLWVYLGVTTAFFLAAHFFKKRGLNKLLLIMFILAAFYGLVGMFVDLCGVLKGMYLLASGVYGTWLQSYVLRLHKEMDHLALQEGFPDFIPALAEPKTMANTVGLTSRKSEFIMRQRKENKENGAGEAAEPAVAGMDELTLDTPLPKSNRKIDNMM